jgi:hypothetical protein
MQGVSLEVMDSTFAFVDLIYALTIVLEGASYASAKAWSWIDQQQDNIHFQLTNKLAYQLLSTSGMDIQHWNKT